MFATEALFLLCRAQMGCLEAALKELDRASRTVARVRDKWQHVSGGTPSQIFNENVMRLARWLASLTARRPKAATNSSLDGGVSGTDLSGETASSIELEEGGASGGGGSAAGAEAEAAPGPTGESPLGSPHSRLGMGARRTPASGSNPRLQQGWRLRTRRLLTPWQRAAAQAARCCARSVRWRRTRGRCTTCASRCARRAASGSSWGGGSAGHRCRRWTGRCPCPSLHLAASPLHLAASRSTSPTGPPRPQPPPAAAAALPAHGRAARHRRQRPPRPRTLPALPRTRARAVATALGDD